MLIGPIRNRHFLLLDFALLALAAYLAYAARLETFDLGASWPGCALFAAVAVVVCPLVFWRAGIYARYWRYASVEEALLLAGAMTIAAVLAGGLSLGLAQLWPGRFLIPRSVPLIFPLMGAVATMGPRFAARMAARSTQQRRFKHAQGTSDPAPQRVLVMGAGDAGAMIVRELQRNPHLLLEVAGFVDDDLGKQNARIHGVPVLGGRRDIPALARAHGVREVIIAMPTAPGPLIREIVTLCQGAGLATRIVPGLYELIDGTVSLGQLREVRIEDLLRRDPVETDTAQVAALLRGKRVLVTGAGGSIGAELCRQVWRCNPAGLVLLGHGENSIFDVANELGGATGPGSPAIRPVIADIRFGERMHAIFEQYRPEVVLHAAAHKHVPLMEANPTEAITNNVLGTRNLLDAAEATGVERFVMISTDKAVNPSSVMGASKRAAERLVYAAAQRTGRAFVAVRFGNVLGSRGSVVQIFKRQIAAGGPVTVTHPEIKRYFMTIPEAVQLALQAAALGHGGEVFVLDMGQPVKIVDLAHDLIRLSGLEEGRDIDVIFTGLRPGEKMFEELFVLGESYAHTQHRQIFVAHNGAAQPDSLAHLEEEAGALIAAAERSDEAAALAALHRMVPEYTPPAAAPEGGGGALVG